MCNCFVRAGFLVLLFTISALSETSFSHQVRPILSDKCFKCHGPDAQNNSSEFRIDTFEEATKDLGGYAGVVPHNIEASRLLEAINSDDPEVVMPPPDSNLSLSDDDKKSLKQWILDGAEYEQHWGFSELPTEVPVPTSEHPDPKNAIDHFVATGVLGAGFAVAPEGSKETWLRRVSFDLTGLPPTLVEREQFLADTSPTAYETVLTRLLTSPVYGERMATEWLDVARYSDSYGYQIDRNRTVWQWRDWVVRNFNRNLSYDQFITHQLAGDLIPESTQETQLATAFNRLHGQKAEGGSVPEEFRQAYIADRVNTVGTAFLGLTMECTKCHDHKYDPLTQKDYFSMAALFSNIDEFGLYPFMHGATPPPALALSTPKQEEQLAVHHAKVVQLEQELAALARTDSATPLEPAVLQDLSGEQGGGRLLNGDQPVNLEYVSEKVERGNSYTFTFTLNAPKQYKRAHIMGTGRATLDSCYRGISMMYEEGRVSVKVAHYYPGDSIEIISQDKLPMNEWMQLTMTYDGSSQADGIKLYLNGQPFATDVRYNQLSNTIYSHKNHKRIGIGAISRDKGLKGSRLSKAAVYERALSAQQVADLYANKPLMQAVPAYAAKQQELQVARKVHNDLQDKIPRIMTMRDTERLDEPYVKTHILNRGMYTEPTDEVSPAVPAVLPDYGLSAKPERLNRLDFAQWLVNPNHPLTARVTVNRYWQMFFGQGLVTTSEDFGHQAKSPQYPELLDWLARDFINSGWDLHHLFKRITLSHTYRQQSSTNRELLERDPENRLLARSSTTPFSAEMLRDNALAHSGLLSHQIGGSPQHPYDLAESFKPSGQAGKKGPGQYRRSLYTHWQVNGPSPLMLTLDSAKRDVCSVKREATATPLRSLVLLNSPQFVEAARATASLLLVNKDDSPAVTAFTMLTSREPRSEESSILQQLYHEQLEYFQSAPDEATELLNVGFYEEDTSLPVPELAALTNTILTILNFDEAQMKY